MEIPFQEIFVPGRVCLFGEHSDWSGAFRRFNENIEKGYTIVCGTNQGLYGRVRRNPSKLVMRNCMPNGEVVSKSIDMESNALLAEARSGSFWSYTAGVAYKIFIDYHVSGLEIDNYRTNLPMGKGLSSSAAICVLAARAFNRLYDLKLTTRGEMEYAYQGEILTPSQCGRMDQSGCAYGEVPVLMEYDGEFTAVENIRLGCAFHLVIVDLKGAKSTTSILRHLQGAFPHAETKTQKDLHRALGELNKDIVFRASDILKMTDPVKAGELLGELMSEAQSNIDKYFVPVCPEMAAPLLKKLVSHPDILPHIFGAKGIGAGGDGTGQLLCKDADSQRKVIQIVRDVLNMEPLGLTLTPTSSINAAVVPAGGFTASLYPASKVIKSELFPIVDETGNCKPLILHTVEQLYNAGLRRIIIVVQKSDLAQFQDLFHRPTLVQRVRQLTPAQKVQANLIAEYGRCVELVIQPKQLGLGDAVLCAKSHLHGKPFLLALGHHLYKEAKDSMSCISQVMGAYNHLGTSVIGLKVSPVEECIGFGTVSAVPFKCSVGHVLHESDAFTITSIVEKPSMEYVQKSMLFKKEPKEEALTIFGLYALEFDVMEYLEYNSKHGMHGTSGYLEFTAALERLRKKCGLTGLIIKGERFSLNSPEGFVGAVSALRG